MRVTVQRAYAFQGQASDAVLVDSQGRVYAPDVGEWQTPAESVRLVKLRGVYDRWCDVPAAHLGFTPWWK